MVLKTVVFYLFWSLLFGLRGNLLGSSGNFLLKSFSANLEFSSILAEKQNLFGLTEKGGIIRLKSDPEKGHFFPSEPLLSTTHEARLSLS